MAFEKKVDTRSALNSLQNGWLAMGNTLFGNEVGQYTLNSNSPARLVPGLETRRQKN
jgi:hypothetical protein